jgi:hypothetical protein
MEDSKEWADRVLLGRDKVVMLDRDPLLGSAPVDIIDEISQLLLERASEMKTEAQNMLFRKQTKGMGWISIEDQLPELDERVLVWGKHNEVSCAIRAIAKEGSPWFNRDIMGKDGSIWFNSRRQGEYFDYPISISHWMPLPPDPEEK